MKLSLGPVPYYWSHDALFSFYDQVAGWPVDIVYLGETLCSKRRSLSLEEWLEVGERLAATGKEVVLSTLSLIEAESELKMLRRICENGRFLVEANDMAAVHRMAGKTPFVTGPLVNLYNQRSLRFLVGRGLKRWVLPVELSRTTLADLQKDRPEGLEVEIYAYGRLPLSLSARCFTARAHNLPKDDCQYRCLDYPEGMVLYSQENQPFLLLNGIQTMSAPIYNLIGELPEMAALQVDVVRITPSVQTLPVVTAFREALEGKRPTMPEAPAEGFCSGYWFEKPGIA